MRTKTLVLGVLVLSSWFAEGQDLALARAAARIDTEIPWITDGFYATDPGRPVPTLPKTDVDRGKLLDQALKRAADEKKLVFWYIPRIEGGHMVRPEFLDTYMRVVAFTDKRLTALINAGFVPLRMAVDAPISQRTGITKLDWVEPAIVILDQDGKMLKRLDRIRTFHVDGFQALLFDVLGSHGERARRIEELLSSPELLLSFVEGLAALDPSSPTGRGIKALQSGDLTQAQSLLADAAGMKDNPRRAEALYNLALTQLLNRDTGLAEETFRRVVAEFVDDKAGWPYAARAAANILKGRDTTPVGPAFHGFEDPVSPIPEALAESRTTTACSRPVGDLRDAVKRAVAFLLRHQGDEGGFEDSRYAYCDSPRILPNVWVAITAIALAGLNDWRDLDPKAIDDVIARGEGYLFNAEHLAPGRNEECYADTFRLIYLARRLPRLAQGSEEATRARRLLNQIAKRLIDQQTDGGFWAHEYPNPFAAAAALLALKQAQDAGAAVPSNVFETGATALNAVRGEQGTFAYRAGRAPSRESDGTFKNAMARMPICERVLLFDDKTPDTTALEAALDNFWKYLPRFERIRTCDFHSDGELGGFFFWHGMFLTSEAIKALPPEKRAVHERKMLEHVMSIGEIDGSFVDSHEVGKSYGTGMALMVLRNSTDRGP